MELTSISMMISITMSLITNAFTYQSNWNTLVVSLSKPYNSTLSSYGLGIIRAFHWNQSPLIGVPSIINIKSTFIPGEQGIVNKLHFDKSSSEIGTDILEILYIKKNYHKYLNLQNYNWSYSIGDGVINSLQRLDNRSISVNTQDNSISCVSNANNYKYKVSQERAEIPNLGLIKKSVRINNYFTIIHNINNQWYSVHKENNVIVKNDITYMIKQWISLNGDSTKSVLDVFNVKQTNLDHEVFIVLIGTESTKIITSIHLFQIPDMQKLSFTLIKSFNTLSLDLYSNSNSWNSISLLPITTPANTKEYIAYILQSNMNNVTIISNINNNISVESIKFSTQIDYKIVDLIFFKTCFYIAYENYGVEIFKYTYDINSDRWNYSLINTIKHPKIKHLDYYVNPFYSFVFLGLQLLPSSASGEIFIEFLIDKDNESAPQINKVLTYYVQPGAKSWNVHKMITLDLFFTYIYIQETSELLVIRRGMWNSIPFISYNIKLKLGKDISDTVSYGWLPISDWNSFENIILFIKENDMNKSLFSFSNFEEAKQGWSCTFEESGNFTIIAVQRSEACSWVFKHLNDPQKRNKYEICEKIIEYEYQIYPESNQSIVTLLYFCWMVFCSVMLILVIILLIKTNCLHKRIRVHVNEKDKNNFKEIYSENNRNTKTESHNNNEIIVQDKDKFSSWNSQFSSQMGGNTKDKPHLNEIIEYQFNETILTKEHKKGRVSPSRNDNVIEYNQVNVKSQEQMTQEMDENIIL